MKRENRPASRASFPPDATVINVVDDDDEDIGTSVPRSTLDPLPDSSPDPLRLSVSGTPIPGGVAPAASLHPFESPDKVSSHIPQTVKGGEAARKLKERMEGRRSNEPKVLEVLDVSDSEPERNLKYQKQAGPSMKRKANDVLSVKQKVRVYENKTGEGSRDANRLPMEEVPNTSKLKRVVGNMKPRGGKFDVVSSLLQ